MTRTIFADVVGCQHCGAMGMGATGWTNTCPDCAALPARQAWFGQLHAIYDDMRTEAIRMGATPGSLAVTPAICARWDALGPLPE